MDSSKRLPLLLLALLPLSLSLLPPTALADNFLAYKSEAPAEPTTKVLHDGVYLGLAGGYDSYRLHPNINTTFNGSSIRGNPVIDANGFVGGIFGGYGQNLNNLFYLGAEALVNLSGAGSISNISQSGSGNSTYSTQFSVKTSFAFTVNPGLKLNPSTLLYARLGLAWVFIHDDENFTSNGALNSTNAQTWTRGNVYGLGLESAVYQGLSLRGEYSHFSYNTSPYTSMGTNYTPSDDQFMLGLIYHII